MSVLATRWLISQLIDQRADYQKRKQKLRQELIDLQKYATNISDGGVSIAELMKTPSSMFHRQMLYMHGAANYSQMSASNQIQQLMMTPYYQQMMQNQTPEVQSSYQQLMYNQFYKQAQSQFSRYEASNLADKQKAVDEELQEVDEQLKRIDLQLSEAKQGNEKALGEVFSSKA